MGTTKSRKSRRNNSRPTAFTFLSNIALGNENEKPPDDSIQRLSTYLSPNAELHYVEEEPAIGGKLRASLIMHSLNHTLLVSSLHSSDSSFSADEDHLQSPLPFDAHNRLNTSAAAPVITTHEYPKRGKYNAPKQHPSESSSDDVQHHKLTREDSERPIASEKIKKKSYHGERDVLLQFLLIDMSTDLFIC